MVNKKHKNNLDELIKQTLSNYEASNSSPDWPQMEKMLGVVPKSNSSGKKYKISSLLESIKTIPKSKSIKWVLSPYFLIAIAIAGGAYIFFVLFNSSKTPENTTNSSSPDLIENNLNPDTLKTATSLATPQDSLIDENNMQVSEDSVKNELLTGENNPEKSNTTETVPKENTVPKEINPVEKTEVKKTENGKIDIKKDLKGVEQTPKEKNHPALINAPDSAKRLNGVSIEKNETNQTSKNDSNIDNPLGRNNFLLKKPNADSIKKSQNQEPKDSLKGPN